MEVTVDEFSAVFDLDRGIANKGDAALSPVGVPGKLEIKRAGAVEIIEWVRLVDERDDGVVFLMSFPGLFRAWLSSPN